jgi:LAO/AO transport system kinase
LATSALEGAGLDELWSTLEQRTDSLANDGRLAQLRSAQAHEWLWTEVREGLLAEIDRTPAAAAIAKQTEADVANGSAFPPLVAREIVEALLDQR